MQTNEQRAREVFDGTPHEDLCAGRHADADPDLCDCDKPIRAMLAFAAEQPRVSREEVAVAIERADRSKVPDGYADGATGMPEIPHDEVSDWSAFIADAILTLTYGEKK